MTKEAQQILARRLNIGPGALRFREHGVELSPLTEKSNTDKKLSYRKALSIWLEHVQEATELTAVVADLVVQKAFDSRPLYPPYGLLEYQFGNYPDFKSATDIQNLSQVRRAMKNTLSVAQFATVSELQTKWKNGDRDPITTVFQRYNMLYLFARDNIKGTLDSIIDIEAGNNTAANRMVWTLENIIEVYENEHNGKSPTINEFVAIAHDSWPYIAKIAAQHRHDLSHTPSDPKFHTLVPSANGHRIGLSPSGEAQLKKMAKITKVDSRDMHPTYGCPALVNFSDGSAIKKLWGWHIDIAESMYDNLYRGGSVNQLLGN